MNDDQAIARGHRAFNELTELNDVFDRLERHTFEKLKQTAVGNDALVQKLHMTLHNMAAIRTALREMVDNGRVAEQAMAVSGLNRPY